MGGASGAEIAALQAFRAEPGGAPCTPAPSNRTAPTTPRPWQRAYTAPLANRTREMVLGAREDGAVPQAHTDFASPRRGAPPPA